MKQTNKKRTVKPTVQESSWVEFVKDTSELTGLRRYTAKKRKIYRIKDAVVGLVDGYIVAAGPIDKTKLRVVVRFSPGQTRSVLESDLRNRLSEEFPDARLAVVVRETYTAGDQTRTQPDTISVTWTFPKNVHKPEAEELARLMTVIVEILKPLVRPRDGRCELCAGSEVAKLKLRNGVPGHYCTNCQKNDLAGISIEKAANKARNENYWNAAVLGLIAALLTAVVAGCVASFVIPPIASYLGDEFSGSGEGAYCFPVIALIVAGPLILPVYSWIEKVAGRSDGNLRVLALILTFLEVVIANAAYYVFLALGSGVPLGGKLAHAAFRLFLNDPVLHIGVLIAMLFTTCSAAIHGGFSRQVPKTKITYETLNDDV